MTTNPTDHEAQQRAQATMFAFQNVAITPDGRSTLDRENPCPFCANECVVMLDEHRDGYEYAAPCPMCVGGMIRDKQSGYWWSGQGNPWLISFEGGCTVLHDSCQRCHRWKLPDQQCKCATAKPVDKAAASRYIAKMIRGFGAA